jgi:hypothetical protein
LPNREEEFYRLAEQRLQALSTEEYQTLHDTVRGELIQSWKNFSLLTEPAQELNIRSRMRREFREVPSLQFPVFSLALLQGGDVGVGVFSESEEALVSAAPSPRAAAAALRGHVAPDGIDWI